MSFVLISYVVLVGILVCPGLEKMLKVIQGHLQLHPQTTPSTTLSIML